MIELPTQLKENIEAYCKLNEIEDSVDFAIKCTKDGLTLDKYGVDASLFEDDNRPTSLKQRYKSENKTLIRIKNIC